MGLGSPLPAASVLSETVRPTCLPCGLCGGKKCFTSVFPCHPTSVPEKYVLWASPLQMRSVPSEIAKGPHGRTTGMCGERVAVRGSDPTLGGRTPPFWTNNQNTNRLRKEEKMI